MGGKLSVRAERERGTICAYGEITTDKSEVETKELTIPKENTIPTKPPIERAYLVGVEMKRKQDGFSTSDSMDELAQLARTAGVSVVGQTTQKIERVNPATLIGKGKLGEIVALREEILYDLLIFDEELHPNQQREIEEAFGGNDIKVLDRTALILDIFAQHARTREGALQVELAQYEYRLPRLTRMWTHLARQAGGAAGRGGTGGVGLRGPGERQLEIDRREIRTHIAHLKREIEDVRTHRREYRRKRRKEGIPVIAIVGYTNAGKSTLLNALSGSDVLAEDKLFATLDPTTRRVKLPSGAEVLFTDTVGFIQKLPTELVAAFRATLEEIAEADVLLHVVDVTHPNAREQMTSVEQTLREIGAGDKPAVIALNKVDRETGKQANRWVVTQDRVGAGPNAARISAINGTGLPELLERVEEVLGENLVALRVRIPYNANELVALFHQRGIVDAEEFSEKGTYIVGKIAARLVERFEPYRR
ncbi:MAG: GTPase HflX [Chloroflexi bacterium]|nr:GTPase HflX [Chloroflexota bacterium]